MSRLPVYIGYDPREDEAWHVAKFSVERRASIPVDVRRLSLKSLEYLGEYTRPTERRGAQLWDVISDAPMATEFAISRFLVPHLCGFKGKAVFMDCDVLVLGDVAELAGLLLPGSAVACVQHQHAGKGLRPTKMDGVLQTVYPRKNWSSVMVFDCAHAANRDLTREVVNAVPGRDLHAFKWLRDDQIGALPAAWNWLSGVQKPLKKTPKLIHYTLGGPWFKELEGIEFPLQELWLNERDLWRDSLAPGTWAA